MQRQNERFIERLPLATDRPVLACLVTTALCFLALFLRIAAEPALHEGGYPYVTFFPAVILASFLFGPRPGIFAAVLCGMLAWYFFIPPRSSFLLNGATIVALGFYILVVGTDIALVHWMQRANRQLAEERSRSGALAQNRELLFRELQHRVSNNLQVVAALLALQRRNIGDAEARLALDDAATRLALIGKISRALYDPNGQRLGVRAFIETLAKDILEANGRGDIQVTLDIDETVAIDADAAIPFSLIVAEAVSNAIEHGFAGREGGTIALTLGKSPDGRAVLGIADDGHGLPEDFTPAASESLGLRIASTLARQLGGSFVMGPGTGGGALATLSIPV
jgi:two-component sensor histidine kinase